MDLSKYNKSQSGNVIVIIFVAIALFGALAFAFNQSSRTSSGFISDSAASAYANDIITILEENRMAVKRMLLKNCDPPFISYEGAGGGLNYNPWPGATIEKKCELFNENGGGLTYKKPPKNAIDESFAGRIGYGHTIYARNSFIRGASLDGDVTYAVHIMIPYIKNEVCRSINKNLFNDNIIPEDTDGSMGLFTQRGGHNFSPGGGVTCENTYFSNMECLKQIGCFRMQGISGSDPANLAVGILTRKSP